MRASILLAVAFHLAGNLVSVLYPPVTKSNGAYLTVIAFSWLAALAVTRRFGAERLSHPAT